MMRRCLSVALLSSSCAATTGNAPIGYDYAHSEPAARHAEVRKEIPDDIVARSAAPVRPLRLPQKEELSAAAFVRELLEAEAICTGEEHDDPAQHFARVWLTERLVSQAVIRGLELGIGLELFQQPFQHVLSAYQRGAIGEDELLRRTEYEERWGHPFQFYRPLLETARRHRLPLIALNVERDVTRQVARSGIEELEPRAALALPSLDLQDREHREDFERRMQGHPGLSPENLERYYQAQVIWDEAMAERSAEWIGRHAPVRRLMIVAGQAHCQRPAIPARMERRGVRRVSTVLLASEDPPVEDVSGYDYALVVGSR